MTEESSWSRVAVRFRCILILSRQWWLEHIWVEAFGELFDRPDRFDTRIHWPGQESGEVRRLTMNWKPAAHLDHCQRRGLIGWMIDWAGIQFLELCGQVSNTFEPSMLSTSSTRSQAYRPNCALYTGRSSLACDGLSMVSHWPLGYVGGP